MGQLFRVRRATVDGPVVECRVDRLAKALRVAHQTARQSGKAVRVERQVHHGWETVTVIEPPGAGPVEAALARGFRPRVEGPGGRQGRVQSYIRATRQCWVTWDGAVDGRPELVAVEDLRLSGPPGPPGEVTGPASRKR